MKYCFLSVALSILLGTLGCKENWKKTALNSGKLQAALQYSGSNIKELEKVIIHYSKNLSDSLKLKAACFLIENMPGKGYVKLKRYCTTGVQCDFDVFDKKFADPLISIDSINKLKKVYEDSVQCGEIVYANPQFIEDVKTIKAEYLIENIEYAFKAWQKPWAQKISFDQFKEFILPYRYGNEPLSDWRKAMFENGNWIYKQSTDRMKMAAILNDSLHKIFKGYGNKEIEYYQAALSWDKLMTLKIGRCDDLNMVVGYWLRANGIPVAAEFTSFWGNSNFGGHSWLGILDTTGKFVPMNAMFDNPVRDSLPFGGAKLAKAYRMKYEISSDKDIIDFEAAPKLGHNYYDITSEYLPTVNYTVKRDTSFSSELFIGVLNGIYWKPLETKTIVHGDSVTFFDLATEILYAPIAVSPMSDKNRTFGYPFVIYSNGEVDHFAERKKDKRSIYIPIDQCINNVYNKKCAVIFWDNDVKDWVRTGETRFITDDPKILRKKKMQKIIEFKNVPANAIYRVIDAENPIVGGSFDRRNSFGRPFVYDDQTNSFLDY